MADRRGAVERVRAPREQPVEVRAVAVDREVVQPRQQLARPLGLGDRLQREQELEVVERPPGGVVARGDEAPAQLEAHRQPLAGLAVAERVVAGQLELEHLLARRHRTDMRAWRGPELSASTGRPSRHSVASPPKSRNRCAFSGTVPVARSQ